MLLSNDVTVDRARLEQDGYRWLHYFEDSTDYAQALYAELRRLIKTGRYSNRSHSKYDLMGSRINRLSRASVGSNRT